MGGYGGGFGEGEGDVLWSREGYMSCIFCDIVAGEAESSKVYEDDFVLAFMDIQPVREGQVIVIPKEHINHFDDLSDDVAIKVFLVCRQVSKSLKSILRPERVGLVVHGFGVPHAHMIVVPEYDDQDITSSRMARIANGEITFSVGNLQKVPRIELDRMAQRINEGLRLKISSPTK